MTFNLNFLNEQFSIIIDSIVDLAALYEVFVLEEYKWEPFEDPKIIIDLGAHIGDTSIYYHLKYPEAKIYAVEPSPETFKKLQKNVSAISNIIPIQVGLGEVDGEAVLNVGKSSLGSSFKSRAGTSGTVNVRIMTPPSLLKYLDIDRADIIKFDIEGGEENLMKYNLQDFARAYIGEVHLDLILVSAEQFLNCFREFVVEKDELSNPKRFIVKASSV